MIAPLVALVMIQAAAPAADPIAHRLYPPQPLIERTRFGQAINFDVELTNTGRSALELTAVKAAVRDPAGRIVQRLEVNDNGADPGISTLPATTWKPGEAHTIYNPFHTLAPDIPVGRIDFEFLFRNGDKEEVSEKLRVTPVTYRTKTRLILPMEGRILVWDGHDFYSHHRRFTFSHPALKQLGIGSNPGRYSFDFVLADDDGNFHKPGAKGFEDYFGNAARVLAPGDGIVAALMNHASDEPAELTREAFALDPMAAVYGNYLVIDHGNGEFSQLGHLKKGSVRVHVGDQVRQGQQVAQVGASGTSLFPHLHYQLTTRAGIDGEGLPSYFDNIARVLGSSAAAASAQTWIDSGDIVETRPAR